MFGDIGPEKLILILVVLIVIFGPKRIPELGGSLGKGIRLFKKSLQGEDDAAAAGDANAQAVQQPQASGQIATPPAGAPAAPAQQAAPAQPVERPGGSTPGSSASPTA
jgi:TatA/E family protein of Tat protein translocase